jgi:hypothetical protein
VRGVVASDGKERVDGLVGGLRCTCPRRAAELSDWIMAYGDAEGIRWCRASLGRDAPDDAAPARREEVAA